MTSNRAAGGVRVAKVRPVRLDCLSGLWSGMDRDGTGWNGSGNQVTSEVKVYVNAQTYV